MQENIARKLDQTITAEYSNLFESIAKFMSERSRRSLGRRSFADCQEYQTLKNLPAPQKIDMLYALIHRINSFNTPDSQYAYSVRNYFSIDKSLLDAVMRTKFDFPQGYSFPKLFDALYQREEITSSFRPLGAFVSQIDKHIKKHGLYAEIQQGIKDILNRETVLLYLDKKPRKNYWGPDVAKAIKKLQILQHDETLGAPPYELSSGPIGTAIQQELQDLPNEKLNKWQAFFHHASSATASKPNVKFQEKASLLINEIGTKPFKVMLQKWLKAFNEIEVEQQSHEGSYRTYTTYEYFESDAHNLLKGLLWTMSRFHDQHSLELIAKLTEKCFQKIPEKGPAAAAVGNAGIYTLAQSKGLGGVSHLSRLKLRIKQNNTQKLIQTHIDNQAERLGITPAQVEELAAPDFGLTDGSRIEKFDDYQLKLTLIDIGNTELKWLKPDGSEQRSVPAFVKNSSLLSDKLKKMRNLAKQIKQASVAQRDRIDRLYTEEMSWDFDTFSKYYLNHGLISCIARKLIWRLNDQPAIYLDGIWQNQAGNEISLTSDVIISLWHPIFSEPKIVLEWRERLEQLEIKQPIKQAHREIYLLTDAEINTRIYSNRMAAHILKQHQFNSLAAIRGWKYSLLGAYDDGRDHEIATKVIPAHNLNAHFYISEIIDGQDHFNDAGIWLYVASDQVRFTNEVGEEIELINIPPLIFSEIMRDTDLFVGVASVGNDPTWQDGGPAARQDYREYWHNYSFGDLSEVAKTRKEVLSRLLPRLKIRNSAKIDGKFLIVQGKRNCYKIHIGSGNILIMPNDRYLCIVPSRKKDKNLSKVFLPFEGDTGLSIVLSKALLLVDEDKIDDPTILNQL